MENTGPVRNRREPGGLTAVRCSGCSPAARGVNLIENSRLTRRLRLLLRALDEAPFEFFVLGLQREMRLPERVHRVQYLSSCRLV